MTIPAHISYCCKKINRIYSQRLLEILEQKGFGDLRPSFLEILAFVADHPGATLKEIGQSCLLKKQTMTSHVNALVERGYLQKKAGLEDKREQRVFFTDIGEKFKLNLLDAMDTLQEKYRSDIGEVELLRVQNSLESFLVKIH